MAPHGIYATASEEPGVDGLGRTDNWIAISCRSDDEWAVLADQINQDWARDQRFSMLSGRLGAEDELDRRMQEWTSGHNRWKLAESLRAVGVPAAAVARPAERIDQDRTTSEWGLWPTVIHRDMGDVRVDGLPVHLSETDWAIERGAPCLGEHNDIVFKDVLGLSAGEIDDLRAEGII
jgi:crotonobetainyl-CoA:carnitine CoA-transferase CaiB-like acyl-CoA transferase